MESRSCDETCCHEQGGDDGHEAAAHPRTRRRLLLIVVTGAVVIMATLVAAILADGSGSHTMWLITLAAILGAIIVVSPLAILYYVVCVVGLLKGRRPNFQVHLSTCIVLMFMASLLLWANVAHDFQGWPIVGEGRSWRIGGHQSISMMAMPGCLLVWSLDISA